MGKNNYPMIDVINFIVYSVEVYFIWASGSAHGAGNNSLSVIYGLLAGLCLLLNVVGTILKTVFQARGELKEGMAEVDSDALENATKRVFSRMAEKK